MQRTVQFFGWKILPGLLLPVLLFGALLGNALLGSRATAESLHHAADHALWVQGDVVKARELYRAVLQDWPASPVAGEAHAGLAMLLEMDKKSSPLIAEGYASAARLSPGNPDAGAWWIASGKHWETAGNVKAAEQAYADCIAHYPAQADRARLALANLKLANGEIDLALEHFQQVTNTESSPAAAIARMGISVSYERMGDLESALAELDESESHWSERRNRMTQRAIAIRH